MAKDLTPQITNTAMPSTQYNNQTDWGLLSDVYKMRIRLCDKEGNLREDTQQQVIGVAVDGDISLDSQYSTPFENSNPEHRLPTLMGMLQAGDWVNTLEIGLSNVFGVELSADTKESLNTLEGRSNFTKVNSTQIYVSSQPVTISTNLYFSAWRNARMEVEQQVALLKQWALPEKLEDGTILASALEDQSLTSLFPSIVPPYVALYYGGKCYLPMLIQSVSEPLVVPMTEAGDRLALQVPVTFVSRTAWDKYNIERIYQG